MNEATMNDLELVFAAANGCQPAWQCSLCGFECPCWFGGTRFETCVECDTAAKQSSIVPAPAPLVLEEYVPGGIHVGDPAVLRETDKAILCNWPGRAPAWVPKSLILKQDTSGLYVAAWFAKKHLQEVIA